MVHSIRALPLISPLAFGPHKQRLNRGFTSRHGSIRLVWYQEYVDIGEAIVVEKRIKRWRRAWKIQMIEEMNPNWRELYAGMGW